jgi:ketosteroid isomerase-like protein
MSSEHRTDVVQIHALLQRWAEAVRERDLDGIVADHSPDIVVFDVQPSTPIRGIDAYESSWRPFWHWLGDDGTWRVRDVVVHAGDAVAFATALIDCIGREQFEVRLTVGLRKVGGRWTVVHEHHSVPASPAV